MNTESWPYDHFFSRLTVLPNVLYCEYNKHKQGVKKMGQAKRRGNFTERLRQAEQRDGRCYQGTIVVADTGDLASGRVSLAETLDQPRVSAVIMVGTVNHAITGQTMAVSVVISNTDVRKHRANIGQIWQGSRDVIPIFKTADYVAEAYIPLDSPEAVIWPRAMTQHWHDGFVKMCLATGVSDQLIKHQIAMPVPEEA